MEEKIVKNEETKEPVENTEILDTENKAGEEKKPVRDASSSEAGGKKVKKAKKQVSRGKASIKCTYNNTIVSISDAFGNVLGWCSSGLLGFKGAKKATPYAATQVVGNVSEKVRKYGVRELEVFVKGVGSGREASVRALANNGFDLIMIKDITPIPHNGCRPKKPRRV